MLVLFIVCALVCDILGTILLYSGHTTNALIIYVMVFQLITMAQNEVNNK